MIKQHKKQLILSGKLGVLFAVLLGMTYSCQENFKRVIPDRDTVDSVDVVFGKPKVLYLIVDGARGASVSSAAAPNLTALQASAIYSFASLSDDEATGNGSNWADMLTGVRKDKHGIVGDDYTQNNLSAYPVVFERVKEAQPNSDIRVFTSSNEFKDNLTTGVDDAEVLADDEAVKNAVIQSLSVDTITFVTGHFVNVDAAGAQYGYDISKQGYKDAILAFDNYVGEILDVLKARPNYSEENWLIVVTSSKGGDYPVPDEQNDNTIFSKPAANTFTIFSSPKYLRRFIGKPFLGNRFQGDFYRFQGQRHAVIAEEGNNFLYNLDTSAFTIELKVKKNPGPNNNYRQNYPSLLGKRPQWSSGWPSNGWVVFLEENFWQFNARGPGNGNQVRGGDLADATWNSIAVVGVVRDGRRYIRTFTNGQFNNEADVQDWGNFNNDALLTMGYINGEGHGEPDVYLADVRIWKVALPDDVVARYACDIGVDSDHPYYDLLIGYWPLAGSTDNTIRDEGPFGSHLSLVGDEFSSDRLAEYLCAPTAENLSALVPTNVDVPSQILSWLKVPRQESWGLDGRVWLDR